MNITQLSTKFSYKLTTLKLNWVCLGLLGTLGLLNSMSLSVLAEETVYNNEDIVNNQEIKFAEDTIVEFEFIESHGAYQSTFGVIDLDSCGVNGSQITNFDSCVKIPLLAEVKASDNMDTVSRRSTYETDLQAARNHDFLGTPGNTVPIFQAEYLFEANKRYAFYLESNFEGKPAGTVYTTDFFNSQGNRQALFNQEGLTKEAIAMRRNNPAIDDNQFEALVNGGLTLNFDDTGSSLVKVQDEDTDFDDFVVGIGGYNCNFSQAQKVEYQKKSDY